MIVLDIKDCGACADLWREIKMSKNIQLILMPVCSFTLSQQTQFIVFLREVVSILLMKVVHRTHVSAIFSFDGGTCCLSSMKMHFELT